MINKEEAKRRVVAHCREHYSISSGDICAIIDEIGPDKKSPTSLLEDLQDELDERQAKICDLEKLLLEEKVERIKPKKDGTTEPNRDAVGDICDKLGGLLQISPSLIKVLARAIQSETLEFVQDALFKYDVRAGVFRYRIRSEGFDCLTKAAGSHLSRRSND